MIKLLGHRHFYQKKLQKNTLGYTANNVTAKTSATTENDCHIFQKLRFLLSIQRMNFNIFHLRFSTWFRRR